jgi:hypothetical protein
MKTTNGSLLHGSERLDYCLNLTLMRRKRNSSKGLKYLLPIFAIFFLASTSPNISLHSSSSVASLRAKAALPTSEACSSEQMISVNDQTIQLEVAKFDASLGKLVGVELLMDCTTMAEIEKAKVNGTDYQLALMIGLSVGLPNQVQKKFMAHGDYWKSAKDETIQKNGFKDTYEQMNNFKEVISENLDSFVGTGNLTLPLSANGLINFKNAESNLVSKLKVRACLNYIYE